MGADREGYVALELSAFLEPGRIWDEPDVDIGEARVLKTSLGLLDSGEVPDGGRFTKQIVNRGNDACDVALAAALRDELTTATEHACEIAEEGGVIRDPVERRDADDCVHGLGEPGERLREVCVDDLDPLAPVGHTPLELIEHRAGCVDCNDVHIRDQIEHELGVPAGAATRVEYPANS